MSIYYDSGSITEFLFLQRGRHGAANNLTKLFTFTVITQWLEYQVFNVAFIAEMRREMKEIMFGGKEFGGNFNDWNFREL